MRKLLGWVLRLALLALALVLFLHSQNNWLSVTRLTLKPAHLPVTFNAHRIVQIGDLHGKVFGPGQTRLLQAIRSENPDLIVFTGDIIDSQTVDLAPVLDLIDGLADYPLYYVTGNHEMATKQWPTLLQALAEREVAVLRNESRIIRRDGQSLRVVGIDDPAVSGESAASRIESNLQAAWTGIDRSECTILLAHRPEHVDSYARAGASLVFAGHAHGGQVIIPFLGGLVAPGQGFFPTYYAGAYPVDTTILVVSRGLGNSVFPQRLFNRPDLVVVTLGQ